MPARRRPPPPPDPLQSAQAAGLRYVSDATPGIRRRRAGTRIRVRRGPTADRSATPPRWPASGASRFRRRTPTCGSAPPPTATSRPPGGTREGGSSTAITPSGARSGTRPSSAACSPSARRCRGSAQRVERRPRQARAATREGARHGGPAARVHRHPGRATTSTRGPTARSGSPRCGTTTWRSPGSTLRFEFRGKSGKTHRVALSDRRLARIVARCQAVPGAELFQYVDDEGERVAIGSGDVNDYLREITGEDFTAKDFRTWAGTLQAVAALDALGPAATRPRGEIRDPPGDRPGGGAAQQHPRRVPEVLRPPRGAGDGMRPAPSTRPWPTGRARTAASGLEPDEQALVRLLRHVSE